MTARAALPELKAARREAPSIKITAAATTDMAPAVTPKQKTNQLTEADVSRSL